MGLDMGAVEDHGAIVGMHAGKLGEDAMEHAFLRPAPKTVVEGLVRAICGRGVLPAQAIADDMDDAADDPAIIHSWNATGIGGQVGLIRANCSSVSQKRSRSALVMDKYSLTNQCLATVTRESLSDRLAKQFYGS